MEANKENIYSILSEVCDPEVPVLTILDLGIVRGIDITEEKIIIQITPTYSGCPAMDTIAVDIKMKMLEHGFTQVQVMNVLSPAWTTDWMSEEGKNKLKAYGIAPPQQRSNEKRINALLFEEEKNIECPRCHSIHTTLLSQFGSTACKALYQCDDCKEPFDYFKCH